MTAVDTIFCICGFCPRGKQQERMVEQASFAVGANDWNERRQIMSEWSENMSELMERMIGNMIEWWENVSEWLENMSEWRMVGQDFPLLFPPRLCLDYYVDWDFVCVTETWSIVEFIQWTTRIPQITNRTHSIDESLYSNCPERS